MSTSPSSPSEGQQQNSGTLRDYKGLIYNLDDPKFKDLSKRAIKRLLKDELWEKTKDERRDKQKEKDRSKRKEKRKKMSEGLIERPLTKRKLAHLSEEVDIGLVIDCAFSHLMKKNELESFVKQLGYTYGKNRTSPKSTKLVLASFDNTLKDALDSKLQTWPNWKDVTISEKSYMDMYSEEKDNLVYLSADSDNVITELEEGKKYIVGGIVDKNRYKNLCQNKATEQGIKTGRLPIGDYLQLQSRKVLTVNQVCEIMLKWLEVRDWEKAFMDSIPGRKLKDVVLNSLAQDSDSVSIASKDDETAAEMEQQ